MKRKSLFKVTYGFSAYGSGILFGCAGSYLMFFLTDFTLLPALFVGFLLSGGKILNALLSPTIGLGIDKSHSKWGKFKPWIFFGTLIVAPTSILLFYVPNLTSLQKQFYAVILYIPFILGGNLYGTAFGSVFPNLTRDNNEKKKYAVIPAIGSVLGDFTSVGAVLPLVGIIAASEAEGFTRLVLIFASIFILFTIFFLILYKEGEIIQQSEIIPVKEILKTVVKNDQLLVLIAVSFFLNIGVFITTGSALYFFKYNLNNENLFATFGITVGLTQVFILVIYPRISKIFTKKGAYLTAGLILLLGYIVLFSFRNIAVEHIFIVYIGGILLYVALGLIGATYPIYTSDIIDYGEWKFGTRNTASVLAVGGLFGSFADAIKELIVGVTLTAIGFVPNIQQSDSTLLGIVFMMTGIPLILVLIAIIIFKFFYKIDDKMYDQIHADITTENEKREPTEKGTSIDEKL